MDARAVVERFVVAFGDGDVPCSGDYPGAEGFSDLISKMMEVLELTPPRTCSFSWTTTRSDGLIEELDVYYNLLT